MLRERVVRFYHLDNEFHSACTGISAQCIERRRVIFFSYSGFNTSQNRLGYSHTRCNLCLSKSCLCSGIKQCCKCSKLIFQCVISNFELRIVCASLYGNRFRVKSDGVICLDVIHDFISLSRFIASFNSLTGVFCVFLINPCKMTTRQPTKQQ